MKIVFIKKNNSFNIEEASVIIKIIIQISYDGK